MSALKKLGLQSLSKNKQHYSSTQQQTEACFGFKWRKRETYDSQAMKDQAARWLVERYLDHKPARLKEILGNERKIILDAGCGSGFSALLFFGDELYNHDYLGVDISDAVEEARVRFLEHQYPADFLRADLMQLPIANESVDIIFSEGVLHHTDSTERAIKTLARKIKRHGKFLFYVYRKKSMLREFTDDTIRQYLACMTDENAWEALKPLTRLGASLGKLNLEFEVEEAVPFLGIPKGKINLQRLFYWHICKMFYGENLSLEEMNHINFDWFRPLNCHRQTPEEVEQWCKEANLHINHINIQESGITIVATKFL